MEKIKKIYAPHKLWDHGLVVLLYAEGGSAVCFGYEEIPYRLIYLQYLLQGHIFSFTIFTIAMTFKYCCSH